ncbi:MAG TPA: heme o synthase [Nitrosarchaeum sp.]|jgi:protoheme IX farnesyltransferase|nr:heme o synthase [Nitrosarchaeum sp.]
MASDLDRVRLGFKEIMEISKPRIVVLLVITAITSMYAASKLVGVVPEFNNWYYLHIIVAGALASAGSSALNHYYDKDIDPKMTRTSTRPIPSGRMPASQVLIYGIAVSCISVIYGYFALNAVSAFFIALGIFSYVIIYTVWLKRLNSSNIVIGGIAGSAAAWAGWSAATGSMDILGFLVGFLVFVWTPSHFWCLAMKIKDEYAQANIPMLPVVIGMQRTSKYILGNTLILLPYSLILPAFGMGLVYTVMAAVSGGLMLAYHYKLTKNPTSEFAWKAYKVTAPYLTIIFVAVALDAAFHFPLF